MTRGAGSEGADAGKNERRTQRPERGQLATGATTEPMTGPPTAPPPRRGGNWAAKVDRLSVPPQGSQGANVAGRRLTGPLQGFGQMWQKTYRMRVGSGISPQNAIAIWQTHFADFWPQGSRFKGPLTRISPGDVALLDVGMGGGVKLSTGVFVMYADEESFAVMTPQGHMFAGWITFSADRGEGFSGKAPEADQATFVQAQLLMRANDPLYELAMMLGGHGKEDQFLAKTMTALGRYLGAPPAEVDTETVCIDRRRQWRKFGSIWDNSMLRSLVQSGTRGLTALVGRYSRHG